MSDGDALIAGACAASGDSVARLVLCDWLDENGHGELAGPLRSEKGAMYVATCVRIAGHVDRAPDLFCLWTAVVYWPAFHAKLRPEAAWIQGLTPDQLYTRFPATGAEGSTGVFRGLAARQRYEVVRTMPDEPVVWVWSRPWDEL